MEFAEGVATGVKSLFGSAVGGAAGAVSKITGVVGKGLATLAFDDEYKAARVRRKEPGTGAVSDIATAGKNVLMVCIKCSVHMVRGRQFCYLGFRGWCFWCRAQAYGWRERRTRWFHERFRKRFRRTGHTTYRWHGRFCYYII
jgi:hypothetical protein